MRIDKLLANTGYGSRKEIKKLLKTGGLKVDGTVVKDPAIHVDPDKNFIELFGEKVEYKPYIYLMMNKPSGVISATEDQVEQTVIDLLDADDAMYEPFPVGRLDKDTTGLLLLTNDGKMAHQLTSPKKKVNKVYRVHLDEPVSREDEDVLRSGVELDDGYITKPAELEYPGEDRTVLLLTITEGKFHQVKRMFQARGRKVVALKRESIGALQLDPALLPGEYRELSKAEISSLKIQ
ncbi:16S rRNA pseudouridine516 synthase [Evansella caseinilytica]|uniref:Pseudouridine synthase n=1 Tax=Evansella caseinilytica TaxID=1503961 RepID=A0A1H3RUW8_9BACI|nr:pseudouridine synthase [Evansella caseinilytica]SDZ29422.1 16S rRNA pseudouridine516 synthase [Evansella caseinilytica]